MTIDDMLGKMDKAMGDNNFRDAEVYATMALKYINSDGALNPNAGPEDIQELKDILNGVVTAAQGKQEEQRKQEEFKKNLIEEIVNFKG